jgi:excinuclease ABC subunit A
MHIRVDGQMLEIVQGMKVDRYKNHDIEVVIDRMKVPETPDEERLKKSISIAMKQGDGLIMILDQDTGKIKHFSKRLMCPTTGISYSDPAPNNFSFNSPQGACPHCKGLGVINQIDLDKVIPNKKATIREGGIVPLGKYKNQMIFWQVDAILKKFECDLNTPIGEIPDDAMNELLYGSLEDVRIDKELVHTSSDYFVSFDGVIKYLRNVMDNDDSSAGQKWADQFLAEVTCPECHGQRLNREALSYTFGGRNIADLANMDLQDLRTWIDDLEKKAESGEWKEITSQEYKIAKEILKEIKTRLDFLLEVGLNYLSLNRQ